VEAASELTAGEGLGSVARRCAGDPVIELGSRASITVRCFRSHYPPLTALSVASCQSARLAFPNASEQQWIGLLFEPPDPDSRSLVRKRARMSRTIEAAFNALEPRADFVMHATYTDHYCEEGKNDWKGRTGYAHRCPIRITRYYGVSGDFRTQMIGFEKLLSTKGWTLPQASITETLRHQHGPLCGTRSRPLFGGGHDAPTCALAHLAKPNEPYTKGNFQLFIVSPIGKSRV
jgi:hypothetical protein